MKKIIGILALSLALIASPLTASAQNGAPEVTQVETGTVVSGEAIDVSQEPKVVVSEGADVASDTTVVVPVGNWISELLTGGAALIGSLALAAFAWFLRLLPAAVANMLRVAQVEQIIQRGVDYGVEAVAGAAKGKSLSVNVGSQVLAEALNYIIQQAPAWFLKFVGGPENLRRMILARLHLDEGVDAQALGVSAPPKVIG